MILLLIILQEWVKIFRKNKLDKCLNKLEKELKNYRESKLDLILKGYSLVYLIEAQEIEHTLNFYKIESF